MSPRRRSLGLSLDYEKCRTWGHAWEDYRPLGKRPPGWGQRFTLRCTRCGCERHDTIDATGGLSSRHYDYPADYQLAADERPTREQLRLDLLRRLK